MIVAGMYELWHNIKRMGDELKPRLAHYSKVMFAYFDEDVRPHVVIQSYYIVLWANVDINYAMNYILSAFCTEINENAVVILLKQLTAFSGKSGDYWTVIRAIWAALLHHEEIEKGILDDPSKKVASFSLITLALFDDSINTAMRLIHDAMMADQIITLATYNCVLRRLVKSNLTEVTVQHLITIEIMWGRTIPTLQNACSDMWKRLNWYELWLTVAIRFHMSGMAQTVQTIGERDIGHPISINAYQQ